MSTDEVAYMEVHELILSETARQTLFEYRRLMSGMANKLISSQEDVLQEIVQLRARIDNLETFIDSTGLRDLWKDIEKYRHNDIGLDELMRRTEKYR